MPPLTLTRRYFLTLLARIGIACLVQSPNRSGLERKVSGHQGTLPHERYSEDLVVLDLLQGQHIRSFLTSYSEKLEETVPLFALWHTGVRQQKGILSLFRYQPEPFVSIVLLKDQLGNYDKEKGIYKLKQDEGFSFVLNKRQTANLNYFRKHYNVTDGDTFFEGYLTVQGYYKRLLEIISEDEIGIFHLIPIGSSWNRTQNQEEGWPLYAMRITSNASDETSIGTKIPFVLSVKRTLKNSVFRKLS